jgi:uncharacterized protein (DUF305 family)
MGSMDADVDSSPSEVDGDGGAGAGVDDAIETDLDEGEVRGGLSWAKVAVLGVALAFLGFAVGVFVTRDRPPGADSADVGFLQDMISHHEQAIEVSRLVEQYGEDPTVRSFATDVLGLQSYEIGVMTEKLRRWSFTPSDRSDQAMAWMDMPVPVDQMPGRLTDEEMAEISQARGTELDQLFLEKMAEHHRGGIHMAQAATQLVDDDDIRALAERMVRNQSSEINEYRGTARTLGFDIDIEPAPVPSS